jgi:hypothetical protein
MVFGPLGLARVGHIVTLISLIAGIGALVTGLISIIREKDRGILVFIAMLFGAFVLAFLVGEILIPH